MIQEINNHVLFRRCDWRLPPEWSRAWQTEIVDSVDGKESRRSLRSVARHTLSFQFSPADLNEQSRLDDSIRQSKKSGLACVPFFGRSCAIYASFTGDTFECSRGWDWLAGDYVYLENAAGYETKIISSANYNAGTGRWTIVLSGAVSGTYADVVYPMLFGKFNCSEMTAQGSHHAPVKITVSELTNSRSVRIGVLPATPPGIGTLAIGSTFIVA